jgi:hypothetical protein
MSEEGKAFKAEFLSVLRGIHVSFVIDSYTLNHHHYIAGLVTCPQLGIRPFLVYLVQSSNEQRSFAEAGAFFQALCEFVVCNFFFFVLFLSFLSFLFFSFFPSFFFYSFFFLLSFSFFSHFLFSSLHFSFFFLFSLFSFSLFFFLLLHVHFFLSFLFTSVFLLHFFFLSLYFPLFRSEFGMFGTAFCTDVF